LKVTPNGKDCFILKKGVRELTLEEIVKGDVISYAQSLDGKVVKAYLSNSIMNGEIQSVSKKNGAIETVTIKGDITYITFYEPMLTALDVSKNPILEYLYIHYNISTLASLDVSKNTALTTLICFGCQLKELDVSKNTALQVLSCNENNLTSLDVSKNTELYAFSCAYNQLTTLDVSKNKALKFLGCDGNDFSSIDVSNNTKLERLSCSNNNLSSLDVSKNTELGSLDCYNNKLTSLDISKNPKLKKLHCYCNQIKTEEMSKLVDALPSWPPQTYVLEVSIYPVKPSSPEEQNEITEEAIKIAEDKNWSMIIY
jgi:hypothetical protein